jgi:Tfp pilus assembly protein PilV
MMQILHTLKQQSAPMLKRLQRGDTIVEVLICIALVSLILTGAYATTRKSTLGIRDAQEHSEALKLAQSQLEQVRQNAGTATQDVFNQAVGTDFCMVNGVVTTTAAPCKQDATGTPTTVEPAYKITIKRATCAVGTNCSTFTIQATWTGINTKTTAFEQVIYRLHK